MALDRRGFLMFLAGGAAGSALTPVAWKLTDDISIWTQNWPWIPRIPSGALDVKPSLLKLGAAEYGLHIKRVNKQPITASGNPDHPLSLGGIDPLGAASVQLMYSPSRIQSPLLKDAQGQFQPIAWAKAKSLLIDILKPLQGKTDAVACVSGDQTGSSREILAAFLQALGSEHLYCEPSDGQALNRVWNALMLGQGQLGFDMDNSDLLVVLEPDLLEAWGAPVKNQKVFGRGKTELIYAGAVQNNTAAVADSWLPIHPDSSGHLALALAYSLFKQGVEPRPAPKGYREYREFVLSHYTPEQASRKTGLSSQAIHNLAQKLQKASRPMIISGSPTGQGAPGFSFFAGLSLNLLLNRINKKGGLTCLPGPEHGLDFSGKASPVQTQDVCAYIQSCTAGRMKSPEMLFVHEANPVYALPDTQNTTDFLDTVPFTVSFSQFMDETAARSDLILPNPYFLERLDDSFTPFGSAMNHYSLALPVTQPGVDAKPTPDLLIALAHQFGPDLGVNSYAELLQKKCRRLGADWGRLTRGETWTSRETLPQANLTLWNRDIETMCRAQEDAASKPGPSLVLEANLKTGSPRTGLPPFGLKAHLEEELSGTLAAVRMNRQTADHFKVRNGQIVKLTTQAGTIKARILLDEGVITHTVAVPTGFGHTALDSFSRNKGGNANSLLSVTCEPGSGLCFGTAHEVQIGIAGERSS